MKREKIKLTDEELEDFDFTSTYGSWKLRGEEYTFIEEIRTDEFSDGPSWDTIVQRKSDNKFFKWNCWDSDNAYYMEDDDNSMEEVFQEIITKTIYK